MREAAGTPARSAVVVGHGCGGGAAVDEEKIAVAQRGHQRLHQRGIGGGARAFVIVHADGVRNGFEHARERRVHLLRVHAHAQLDCSCVAPPGRRLPTRAPSGDGA